MRCKRANIPITIIEGGTFDKLYKWRTGDSPQIVVDLTGFTAKLMVRAKYADATPLISGVNVTDPFEPDGDSGIYFALDDNDEWTYRFYLNNEDTAEICAAHKDIAGVYDLFLLTPAGEAVLQHFGIATLIAAVTR